MKTSWQSPPRGAAALEFALVLPLLLLLVMGGIDWGHFFYVEHLVTNAAREGARIGSLQASSEAEAADTARTFLTNAGLDGAKATVAVDLSVESCRVHIDYPAGSLTGFSERFVPRSAHAIAEMRR